MTIHKESALGWTIVILLMVGFFQWYLTIHKGDTASMERTLAQREWTNDEFAYLDGHLHTTPDLQNKWQSTVNQTKETLQWQVYNLTNRDIKAQLKELSQGGTQIEMIIENRPYNSYGNKRDELLAEFEPYPSISFRSDQWLHTNFVHSKFRVTDNHAIVQTANLTYDGLNKSKEHQFISSDPDLHNALSNLFEQDREQQEKSTDTEQDRYKYPNLLVCPFNCRDWIENLLEQAEESIIIWNQYITDQSIRNIIKKQERNNIDMKMLVSNSENNDDLIRYFDWETARQLNKPYMHTKTMLVDGIYLVLWSINFSQNSLDNNREVAVIITAPTLIEERKNDFQKHWKLAEDQLQ